MSARSVRSRSLIAAGLSVCLLASLRASAQPAPPPPPPLPPGDALPPPPDAELIRRLEKRIAERDAKADDERKQLEKRIAELEARGAAEKKPEETKPEEPPAPAEPFAFADFTWLNGNNRQKESLLDSKYFTGSFMIDANYTYSLAHPKDHSLVGSTTSGRTNEIQLSHVGIGGDFHWNNVRGRFMTQFGLYSTMTVRNDPSPSRGQWGLADAYRYVTEASGGYHWNVWNGINFGSQRGLMEARRGADVGGALRNKPIAAS